MIKNLIASFSKRKKILAFLPAIFYKENVHDRVDDEELTVNLADLTGLERLKNLFTPTENHPVHPQVAVLGNVCISGFVTGGIIGAFKESREAFITFIENNEATTFRSHMDAKRKLQDKMILACGKGFVKLGTKVSFFTTIFMATQIVLTTYQNQYSFLHHTAAGASAGALYKINFGLKGMISGGLFGSLFGTAFGVLHMLLLKVSNITEEDLKKYRESIAFDRHDEIEESKKKMEMKDEEKRMLHLLQSSMKSGS